MGGSYGKRQNASSPEESLAVGTLKQADGHPEVILRKTPQGDVLVNVPNGEAITVLAEDGDHLKVRWKLVVGWSRRGNVVLQQRPSAGKTSTAQLAGGEYEEWRHWTERPTVGDRVSTVGDRVWHSRFGRDGVIIRDFHDSQPYRVKYDSGEETIWLYEHDVSRQATYAVGNRVSAFYKNKGVRNARVASVDDPSTGSVMVIWEDGMADDRVKLAEKVWPRLVAAPFRQAVVAKQAEGWPDVILRTEAGTGETVAKVPNGAILRILRSCNLEQGGEHVQVCWNEKKGWGKKSNFAPSLPLPADIEELTNREPTRAQRPGVEIDEPRGAQSRGQGNSVADLFIYQFSINGYRGRAWDYSKVSRSQRKSVGLITYTDLPPQLNHHLTSLLKGPRRFGHPTAFFQMSNEDEKWEKMMSLLLAASLAPSMTSDCRIRADMELHVGSIWVWLVLKGEIQHDIHPGVSVAWKFQGDHCSWRNVLPEDFQTLEQAYRADPARRYTLRLGPLKSTYEVDFINGYQRSAEWGKLRGLRRVITGAPRTTSWEFKDDHGEWQSFLTSHQLVLQRAFNQSLRCCSLQIGQQTLQVDFDAMLQESRASGKVRSIRRSEIQFEYHGDPECPKGHLLQKDAQSADVKCEWCSSTQQATVQQLMHVCSDSDCDFALCQGCHARSCWQPFASADDKKIVEASTAMQLTVRLHGKKSSIIINLESMTQTNASTGRRRTIRQNGLETHVEKVHRDILGWRSFPFSRSSPEYSEVFAFETGNPHTETRSLPNGMEFFTNGEGVEYLTRLFKGSRLQNIIADDVKAELGRDGGFTDWTWSIEDVRKHWGLMEHNFLLVFCDFDKLTPLCAMCRPMCGDHGWEEAVRQHRLERSQYWSNIMRDQLEHPTFQELFQEQLHCVQTIVRHWMHTYQQHCPELEDVAVCFASTEFSPLSSLPTTSTFILLSCSRTELRSHRVDFGLRVCALKEDSFMKFFVICEEDLRNSCDGVEVNLMELANWRPAPISPWRYHHHPCNYPHYFAEITTIRQLDFSRLNWGVAEAIEVGACLYYCVSLTELDFSYNTLNDDGTEAVLHNLKFLPNLRSLMMAAVGMSPDSLDTKRIIGIEQLNLGGNKKLGDVGATLLANAFPHLPLLQKLWLYECGVSTDMRLSMQRSWCNAQKEGTKLALDATLGTYDVFLEYIERTKIKWLTVRYLRKLASKRKALPKQQDISSENCHVGSRGSRQSNKGRWVISHPWKTRQHPDPFGSQLAVVVQELNRLNATDDDLVFYDFGSLAQLPRERHEDVLFAEALAGLEILFSTPDYCKVVIIVDNHLNEAEIRKIEAKPNDEVNYRQYFGRGWCFFEYSIAHLFDTVANADHSTVRNLKAPIDADEFRIVFETKRFTKRGDKRVVLAMFDRVCSSRGLED